jgi:hypothetical protein
MARTGPGTADRQLISQLAARDLSVSAAQLERWRHAGLLPRNSRHGRGRGRGSLSEASPEAVEIAAALGRHARQGRDLRLAVADWFAEAGLPAMPGEPVVPEPPHAAVHAALTWIIATSPAYRLIELARSARTDAEQDAFYDTAAAALRRMPSRVAGFDVAAVREALLARRDLPDGTFKSGKQVRSGMIQLIAGTGMGYAEIGADALAEAFAETGLSPSISPESIQRWLARLEEPPPDQVGYLAELLVTRYDPLKMLQLANVELLRQARITAYGLAWVGGLYFMHAMLMPDTPGLAALRATIDQLGVGPVLMQTSRMINTTDAFAISVVSCLHPIMTAIHKVLDEQITSGPPLIAANERDVQKFMADWTTTLKDTSLRRRRDRAAGG